MKAFSKPQPTRLGLRIAAVYVEILACFFAVGFFPIPAVVVFAWLILGTRIHSLSLIGHDITHGLFMKRRKWNDFFGNILIAAPIGISSTGYRAFHFEHHRQGWSENDPEVKFQRSVRSFSRPVSKFSLSILFLKDLFGLSILDIMRAQQSAPAKSKWEKVFPSAFAMILISSSILAQKYWIPVLWYGSIFTSYWVCFRIRTLSEHKEEGHTFRFDANPLLKYLFWPQNTWCHYEHHTFPTISLVHLPSVRKSLDREHGKILSVSEMMDEISRMKSLP